MKSALLAGRTTTALGFGGSLLGSTAPEVSKQLLNTAFEAGIRHFDVAPMYGFGRSERMLRDTLGTRLNEVTITTKYGLAPPRHSGWIAPVHRAAKQLLAPFPALKRKLQRVPAESREAGPPLTAEGARASAEESLRQLGVDVIDLFLLHEATPARVLDDTLLEELERLRDEGKIRAFGVGSNLERTAACLRERPRYCVMLQCEWNVFTPAHPEFDVIPGIRHGSLSGPREAFERWLLGDSERLQQWSAITGYPLDEPGALPKLLFRAAVEQSSDFPNRILLFSSRRSENILINVRSAVDPDLARPARELYRLIQSLVENSPQEPFQRAPAVC